MTKKAIKNSDNFVFDIETGSLITSPCPYRIVQFSDGYTATVKSKFITTIPSNGNFKEYADQYLYDGINVLAKTNLKKYKVSEDQLPLFSGQLSAAYCAHTKGDEIKPEITINKDGFGYANGINVSPDGRKLYVAATTRMALKVYDRDLRTGKLALKENIRFDTGLDNIEIGPEGALWIGSHPQLLKFVAHSKDSGKLSPSQVLRVELKDDGVHQIDEVYLNSGEELSGSSVGAVYRDRLLIGSVFEDKLLDCRFGP